MAATEEIARELPPLLERLVRREEVGEERARWLGDRMMEGALSGAQMGAVLALLRSKGETVAELAGLVASMRHHSLKVELDRPALDTCGTGGDGLGTFNISTVAALVVAGAGVAVAKHGNRAASGRCGSADVLEALGVRIDLPPEGVAACVRHAGVGFMFAPRYHPAMRHVAAPRAELGIRTVFNILGPLSNPAQVPFQSLGVADPALAAKMAGVLAHLGGERALVFAGPSGMDELGLDGPSSCWRVEAGRVARETIDPSELGLAPAAPAQLAGGGPEVNAALAVSVLEGEPGPRADVVALNAAAGLVSAGGARDLAEGMGLARESLVSGAGLDALERLRRVSQEWRG
jgi:anthranilate phosphoribosyltransferase